MITLHHVIASDNSSQEKRVYISAINDWQLSTLHGAWKPAVDVFEYGHFISVRMEIAGMKEADFNITICEQKISITGVRSDHTDKKAFQQMEIIFGAFKVEVEIAHPFLVEGAEAVYSDGFLTITLPKE